MTSAQEILTHYSLHSPSTAPGRYYTTCPQCSGSRTRAHQKLECLGITIDDKGVNFGRNHCGWTGGAYYASKLNGSGGNAAFVAVYDYVDRDGVLLFQVCRRADKQFPQRRPDGAGGWAWGTKRIKKVLFHLPELIESVQNNHTVLIPEGEKDVINLERIGYKATTSPGGASEPGKQPKWRKEYNEALRGADVVLLPDHDAAGYAHTQAIAESLDGVAKSIRILKLADHWAECPKGGDISDWLKAGHTCEQLDDLIKNHANPWAAKEKVQKPTPRAAPTIEPTSLANVVKVFNKWLALSDTAPLYALLGTIAANLLSGDPVWLGIIAPPSSAKTELLNALSKLPYVVSAEALSPAALLSGTSKRQKAKTATGGLLMQLGDFGVLAFKDFGTVLEMRIEARSEMLAALRRVFDGEYIRQIGSDGGQTISWAGKIGVVFGATQKYDLYHGVIGTLGDRFLLIRMDTAADQFKKCMAHIGVATRSMREELATAVAGLFASLPKEIPEPDRLNDQEMQELERTVMLAIRLRAGVERDRVRREIEAVYDPEGPARLALSLERLRAGLLVIGLDRRTAMQVVTKVAMDSTPRFRLQAYNALTDDWQTTKAIALALELPATTTQRALEDLVAQGLAAREEKEAGANRWRRVTDPTSEPEDFYPQNTSHGVNDGLSSSLIRKKKTEEDFAGNSSPSLFETTDLKAAPEDHRCVQCRGQVDGSERPYTTRDGRTVWLHPTCKRFFHS